MNDLERIAIAIEDNTRAVRETLVYIRKRDAEQAEICAPTYRTAAELNALIIGERKARARSPRTSIIKNEDPGFILEEIAPGSRSGTWDDVVAEEIR